MRMGGAGHYPLLADFRVAHQETLNELLTQTITLLLADELVTLRRVAQDPFSWPDNAPFLLRNPPIPRSRRHSLASPNFWSL